MEKSAKAVLACRFLVAGECDISGIRLILGC